MNVVGMWELSNSTYDSRLMTYDSMRNFKEVIIDMGRKAPILFPLVGGFHILLLLWTIFSDTTGIVWLEVLWMTGYTVFWLAACDLRKWGALGYIILTIINASLYFAIANGQLPRDYLSSMFLLDGLFSVFLLFYYKRFS